MHHRASYLLFSGSLELGYKILRFDALIVRLKTLFKQFIISLQV